jgi:hypothetical protein
LNCVRDLDVGFSHCTPFATSGIGMFGVFFALQGRLIIISKHKWLYYDITVFTDCLVEQREMSRTDIWNLFLKNYIPFFFTIRIVRRCIIFCRFFRWKRFAVNWTHFFVFVVRNIKVFFFVFSHSLSLTSSWFWHSQSCVRLNFLRCHSIKYTKELKQISHIRL